MLPPDLRHNIFLIAKEALTNVLKHAGSATVQVAVKVDGREFKLAISDDGQGFDPGKQTTDQPNNGLGNMRRRAEATGGALNLTSAPGQGTRLELKVTLPG
jgi:signal transduction histidine kinase